MKLKFKKQKIASLHLMRKIKGGTDPEPSSHTELGTEQTNIVDCNISEPIECTLSLNNYGCVTNDGTLKTWNPSIIGEGSITEYC